MISLILIVLASILNSCMDNIKDHWYKSIFNKLNPNFWNPEISWKKGFIPYTQYHFDAWHLFKSGMLYCLIGAVVLYDPIYYNWVYFGVYGIAWIVFFDLFYNYILIRK